MQKYLLSDMFKMWLKVEGPGHPELRAGRTWEASSQFPGFICTGLKWMTTFVHHEYRRVDRCNENMGHL